jgi:TolA-binding protein
MSDERQPSCPDLEHPWDLSVLARRGLLTEPERRRLEMCLSASESLRLMHQLGCDFDELSGTERGDADITHWLTSAAAVRYARLPMRGSSRIRKLAGISAVAISLVAAGAFAARWQWPRFIHLSRYPSSQAQLNATGPAHAVAAKNAVGAASACQPACRGALVLSAEAGSKKSNALQPAPSRATSDTLRDRAAPAALPVATTSKELFSAANAARRLGDHSKSMDLYRRLQSEFPGSAEAALSFVLLARLELAHGFARQAVAHFDEYLSRNPDGTLRQEALQGKAQALRQLGDTSQEAATWRELLRRFPDSMYAPTARERLGERE